MQVREAKNTVVAGARGHGKSTTVNEIVTNKNYPRKNGILYKVQMNLHDAAFPAFKTINSMGEYTGGLAKIGSGSVDYKKFLHAVTHNFTNGFVIIDDAKVFERHTLSPEASNLLTMSRHNGVDVFFVYHSLKYIPIEMYEGIDWVILFHTVENINSKLSSLPAGDLLIPATERVRIQAAKGNKYYREYIKLT